MPSQPGAACRFDALIVSLTLWSVGGARKITLSASVKQGMISSRSAFSASVSRPASVRGGF